MVSGKGALWKDSQVCKIPESEAMSGCWVNLHANMCSEILLIKPGTHCPINHQFHSVLARKKSNS
jgi:hypothetical protein